ncbi:MAG: MotA/TolQ/ExbB proton channel family protein [Nannocystaceae bacterium]
MVDPVELLTQFFLTSGAGWVLWLLACLSLISFALTLERWLVLRARRGNLHALAKLLDARLSRGELTEAIRELEASPAIAAHIAASGLKLASRGPEAAAHAMESSVALARTRLERGLAFLGTLGNNAPFIGLLGTVIGVIGAFDELGRATPAHDVAGSSPQVASQAVMASIAEALVATAVGIFVALPAVAAYNYFQRQITGMLAATEVLSKLVLAYITPEPDTPEAP